MCSPQCHAVSWISTLRCCHPYQVQSGLSFFLDIDCNIKFDIKKKRSSRRVLSSKLLIYWKCCWSTCTVSIKALWNGPCAATQGFFFNFLRPGTQWREALHDRFFLIPLELFGKLRFSPLFSASSIKRQVFSYLPDSCVWEGTGWAQKVELMSRTEEISVSVPFVFSIPG